MSSYRSATASPTRFEHKSDKYISSLGAGVFPNLWGNADKKKEVDRIKRGIRTGG